MGYVEDSESSLFRSYKQQDDFHPCKQVENAFSAPYNLLGLVYVHALFSVSCLVLSFVSADFLLLFCSQMVFYWWA